MGLKNWVAGEQQHCFPLPNFQTSGEQALHAGQGVLFQHAGNSMVLGPWTPNASAMGLIWPIDQINFWPHPTLTSGAKRLSTTILEENLDTEV